MPTNDFIERRKAHEARRLLESGEFAKLNGKNLGEIYDESALTGAAVVRILMNQLRWQGDPGNDQPPEAS